MQNTVRQQIALAYSLNLGSSIQYLSDIPAL